jgi:hypothetical protein
MVDIRGPRRSFASLALRLLSLLILFSLPSGSLFSLGVYSTMWNFFPVARNSFERSLHHPPLSDSDDETLDLSHQHPIFFPFARDGTVRVMRVLDKKIHSSV